MDRFAETEDRFKACLKRARGFCDLQQYLADNHTDALDSSDMLRSAVVLCVSAFDFLVHELFRIEVIARYRGGKAVDRLLLPFEVAITQTSSIEAMIESHVKDTNSYKSFVDPGKYSEAMGCFVNAPWDKVAAKLGTDSSTIKNRVRAIYRWRNRIAHEADINPVYAGVELWPIMKKDVVDAIDDFETLGIASIEVLREG